MKTLDYLRLEVHLLHSNTSLCIILPCAADNSTVGNIMGVMEDGDNLWIQKGEFDGQEEELMYKSSWVRCLTCMWQG